MKATNQRDIAKLQDFPFHVTIAVEKSTESIMVWLLEKGPPTDLWDMVPTTKKFALHGFNGHLTYVNRSFDTFVFKNRYDALLFKILWEHRDPHIKWLPGFGAIHLEN